MGKNFERLVIESRIPLSEFLAQEPFPCKLYFNSEDGTVEISKEDGIIRVEGAVDIPELPEISVSNRDVKLIQERGDILRNWLWNTKLATMTHGRECALHEEDVREE